MDSTSSLGRAAGNIVLVGIAFLLPFFFVPLVGVPFAATKAALVAFVVIVAFFLLLIDRLKRGNVVLPLHPVLAAVWGLALVYFVAALVSPNPALSLIDSGAETGTFAFVVLAALLTTLVPILFTSKESILRVCIFLFGSAVVLVLFQALRLIFGTDFLSFGILTGSASNLLGKWNDLAIFFGLAAILSLVTLEGLRLAGLWKWVVSAVLLVSLFFLALINFFITWVAVGFVALGLFVYSITKNRRGGDSDVVSGDVYDKEDESVETSTHSSRGSGVPIVALVVLVVATVFMLFSDTAGAYLSNQFTITQIEARPSWQSTINVAKQTYAESPILGSGPNTFAGQWALGKPREINDTVFWSIDFNAGIGYIPTAFVETGVVGGALWVVFFALLLWSGFRALILRGGGDNLANYLSLSSFVGALYLFTMAVVYNPNIVLLVLAFLLTGLFLATLRHVGVWREAVLSFEANPRLGFVSVLLLTVLLILSAVSLFIVGGRYASALSFQRGLYAGNVEGDLARAEEKVQKAVDLYASDRYFRALADINLARINQIAASGGTPEEQRAAFQTRVSSAVQSAQSATNANAQNYQNWMTLGRIYSSFVPLGIEGAYENALRAYDRARELNPHHPVIPYTLAQVELVRGDSAAARERITEAIEKKGNYTAAIYLLAQLQIAEGEIDSAVRSVEAGALLDPQNPVVFFQLGLLYYNQGRDNDAIAVLERAVALNTVYSNARYFLGLAYYRTGRTDEAIAQFEQIAALNPDNGEVQAVLENLRADRDPFDVEGVSSGIGDELPIAE